MFDILLFGGTLIDGMGAPPRPGDIGIVGDRVAALGDLAGREAHQALDISGLFIVPGFIDIHTHSDLTLLEDSRAASKVRQGVTSEVCGNCGFSAAPLFGQARDELPSWSAGVGLEPDWCSLADYLAAVGRQGVALNFGTLVGHGNLRVAVMGGADRHATSAERAAMAGMLTQALEEGGLGLSSGLFYTPGSYADPAEMAALGEVVAAHGGLYTSHIRNEGLGLEAALEEAMDVGRASGVPVQVSHLKLASRDHWGQAERILARLDASRARGLDLGWDQYPYTAAATGLDAAVPPRFHAGGTAALLQRLGDPQSRDAIIRAIDTEVDSEWENMAADPGWGSVTLSYHPTRPNLTGRTVADIAASSGSDPLETVLDLILETEAQAGCVIACMDERDVAAILRHPVTIVVSDAEALAADGPLSQGIPHPRAYGTYPRVFARYVRERRLLTWEQAVHKMTGLPAARLGLHERGVVQEGAYADLAIFDPATIADTATFEMPHSYPVGIPHVLVNGRFAVYDGVQTKERAGQRLSRDQ